MIQYPLVISDKAEHSRMIRDISKEVVNNLPPREIEKPFLKVSDLKVLVGKEMALRLLKNGDIKVSFIHGSRVILMKEYKKWESKLK